MALVPAFNDELLGTFLLGGIRSPGRMEFRGADAWENWNVQKPKGESGATTKLEGRTVRQFEAHFYFAQSTENEAGGDLTLWEEQFRPLLESTTNGPKPTALPIYHPDLAAAQITEVVSGGISAPTYDAVGGVAYVVRLLEYRPPKPKPPKPPEASVRQGVTVLEAPDPNAAAKAELEALVSQAREPLA